MPISTSCPNCKAIFRLPDDMAGKTVKCQKCQQLFVVPQGSGDTVAAGAMVAAEAPPVLLAVAPPPPPPTPLPPPPPILNPAPEDAIEERDHDEPPPLPKKRRPLSEPRRRDEPAKSNSGSTAIILTLVGLSVLLCVVCGGAGAGFYALMPKPAKRPIAKKDKAVRDDVAKVDGMPFDGPKDMVKFDGIKDGFAPPLAAGPVIPVVFGADGLFNSDNVLNPLDPTRDQRHYKLYSIRMEAGKHYEIDMVSRQLDSYLYIFDDKNAVVSQDDDSGGDLNSRIFFTPLRTGNFRIMATSFGPGETGAFNLTVRRRN